MNEYDIKRFALVLALQADMEGMKAENEYRRICDQSPAYGEKQFNEVRNQLHELAYKHNDQL